MLNKLFRKINLENLSSVPSWLLPWQYKYCTHPGLQCTGASCVTLDKGVQMRNWDSLLSLWLVTVSRESMTMPYLALWAIYTAHAALVNSHRQAKEKIHEPLNTLHWKAAHRYIIHDKVGDFRVVNVIYLCIRLLSSLSHPPLSLMYIRLKKPFQCITL